MNKQELQNLRARIWAAKSNRQALAGASDLVRALESQAGPAAGFEGDRGSVEHLLALVERAIRLYDVKPKRQPR